MSSAHWGKVLIAAVVLPIALVFVLSRMEVSGQQAGKKEDKAAAKDDKKPSGQLPPYFSKIVSEDQKVKIYSIQAKYKSQMDALQAQLAALREKRDAEVEGVLDKEQLAKLEAARKEAAEAKKAKSDKKPDAPKTTAAEPAKK